MYREVQVRIPVALPKMSPMAVTLAPSSRQVSQSAQRKRDVANRAHIPKTPSTVTKTTTDATPVAPTNSLETPHIQHRPEHHPAPKTPLSSFKSLASTSNGTPATDPSLATPLKGVGGMGEWIGQMSMSSVKDSPFMGRIKGLALGTPSGKPGTSSLTTPPSKGGSSSSETTSDRDNGVSQAMHSRGGSDDISSGADGSTLSSRKRKNNATINQVEETYAKAMSLQEKDVFITTTPPPERPDMFTPPPRHEVTNDINTPESDGKFDIEKRMATRNSKPVDNSMLVAATPKVSVGPQSGLSLYSPQVATSSESTGSRDEVLVPMYVANGFCMLSAVPCFNALRQPLTMLASNSDRLKTVLESMKCDGYNDLETSEDDIDYEYSDDSSEGGDGGGDSVDAQCSHVYEINAKTRCLRALNIIETDRSLVNLRQAHADMNMNMKLPSLLRSGGAQDFNAEMIFRALSPKNFVTILIAFLLEFKIAIVSSKISALLAMGELLKVLISPLKWSHVYCPLLPKRFSNDLLQCPTPFFVGVQREFLDLSEIPNDVIVLDIDQNSCSINELLARALYAGKKLTKTLTSLITPALFCCDEIAPPPSEVNAIAGHDMASLSSSSENMVREVLRSCKLFIADILVGLEECCTFGVDHDEALVLFDEAMFIASKQSRSKESMLSFQEDTDFLDQFLRTQGFSLCIIGSILKKLGPDSRPPSRPSSPYIPIPSPTLLTLPQVGTGGGAAHVHALSQQLPTTPVQRS